MFVPTLEQLAGDRSTSLRARLAHVCCNLCKAHAQTAMRLMLRLTDTTGLEVMEERLRYTILSTDSMRNILRNLDPADYGTLQLVVERCQESEALGATTAAAQAAGKATALSKDAQEACERSLLDTVETREAAGTGLSGGLKYNLRSDYVISRLSGLLFEEHGPTRE